MIVVADTSPLNYLIQIGQIDVLQTLYARVLIPTEVLEELSRAGAPAAVRNWAVRLPGWCEAMPSTNQPNVSLASLDAGERAAIQLALEVQATTVLIDELLGRRLAAEHGLIVRGTLGVLKAASLDGLLDLRTAVELLLKTNFAVTEAVLNRVLNVE